MSYSDKILEVFKSVIIQESSFINDMLEMNDDYSRPYSEGFYVVWDSEKSEIEAQFKNRKDAVEWKNIILSDKIDKILEEE